jgi:dCTP deaminase
VGILTYTELKQLCGRVITNCPLELVNAASIDVTLGKDILVENLGSASHSNVLDLRARDAMPSRKVTMTEEGYVLAPGQFVLAHTEQVFNIPLHMAAEYKLKSSMARMGLNHSLAGWCDPGWNGSVLTLEISNLLMNHKIRIRPGDPIGQVVFFTGRTVPREASYEGRGRYNGDKTVSGVKL